MSLKVINRLTLSIFTCFQLALMTSPACFAGEKTKQVIADVVTSYGGERLSNISTISLQDQFNTFRDGQSYSPTDVDIENNRVELFIDIAKQRKDFRWVIGDKDSYSIRHWLFDGNDGYAISHSSKTHAKNDMVDFSFADRRHSHLLDTVIVQMLSSAPNDAIWLGEVDLFGDAHDKLRFTLKNDQELHLYFDQQSGLLTYMENVNQDASRTLRYRFKSHKKQQGIFFAQTVHVTRGGKPNTVITDREIAFNKKVFNQFDLPKGYGESAASMDMSEMSVQKVTDGVYLAGQRWGYSVFVDTGDGFIAAGGYSNLSKRFDAVKSFAKIDKPLQKMVVSHHHNDHIRGVPEAIKLGASFIITQPHVDTVNAVVDNSLNDEHFNIVENVASFADGKVIVIDMPSGHSSHNLMTYIPAAKLLFTADTYFSRQLTGTPFGGAHLHKIKARMKALNLPVEKFAAAHSSRVLTVMDFEESLTKKFKSVCPTHWAICQVMNAD